MKDRSCHLSECAVLGSVFLFIVLQWFDCVLLIESQDGDCLHIKRGGTREFQAQGNSEEAHLESRGFSQELGMSSYWPSL